MKDSQGDGPKETRGEIERRFVLVFISSNIARYSYFVLES